MSNLRDLRDRMDENGNRFYTARAFDSPSVRKKTLNSMTPDEEFDVVVGMETMGLPLGALVAEKMNLEFVAMREKGKIPVPKEHLLEVESGYEHRDKILTLDSRQLSSGCEVLLVDDWIESGNQITAAIRLLENAGVYVSGISVIGTDRDFNVPEIMEDINLYTAIE